MRLIIEGTIGEIQRFINTQKMYRQNEWGNNIQHTYQKPEYSVFDYLIKNQCSTTQNSDDNKIWNIFVKQD